MTTTHTPGPWTVDLPSYAHRAELIDTGYHFIDGGKGFYPEGFGLSGCLSLADARLIAAAPDLLAVAAMLDRIAGQVPFTGPFHDAIVAARAAIAKAKGE